MKYLETSRSFYIKLLTIALPVAMQSVITTGVNLMDTIMLGQLGEIALSASALGNQFITLFQFLCMGISMGACVLTSRFWGAGDFTSLKKVITIALRFSMLLGLIFTVANVLFANQILSLYSNEQPVIESGASYLRWSTLSYLLMALSIVTMNIMRSVNLPGLPFFASVVAFFVNIGGNYIFIFGKFGMPEMGVAGAALGTVIARVVETGIICGYFYAVNTSVGYRVKDLFCKCGELLGEFVRISVPVMISDGLLGIGDSALAMVMGRIGAQFVSANAITLVVQKISTIFISGMSYAGCFITGQTLGEGNQKAAQRQGYTLLFCGVAVGVLAGLIIYVIREPIISAYNITQETREIARQLMDAISIIIIFRSANSILTKGVLRGGGDTKFLMVADTSMMWLISLPLGALAGLVLHWPAFWVFACLNADQIVKAIWCVFRLKSGKWIKKIQSAAA